MGHVYRRSDVFGSSQVMLEDDDDDQVLHKLVEFMQLYIFIIHNLYV